jgi:hypothetical protein
MNEPKLQPDMILPNKNNVEYDFDSQGRRGVEFLCEVLRLDGEWGGAGGVVSGIASL